jgi:pyrroline-5-carboxylate reductase
MTGALPEVLLVGCGKMGGALLSRWLASGLIGHAVVVEPGGAEEFATHPQVTVLRDPSALAPDFQPDALVLAIKPQMMEAALPAYRAVVRPGMLVLSIAAGRTLASFRRHLGADADLVRAMPNTPAAIGRGITVAVAAAGTADAARDLAGRLLEAVGSVEWVDDESLLDAVTALSGGGPAYVFLLIEALAAAGVRVGLPAALAMRLANWRGCRPSRRISCAATSRARTARRLPPWAI